MNYPNQGLMASAEWLDDHLEDESVVVLDVRAGQSLQTYRIGHIPGALPFSLPHGQGAVDGTPDCLLEPAMRFQLSVLGIHPDHTVVLYDAGCTTALTNSFWAFERMGQRDVRVLEGGLNAWQSAGRTLTSERERRSPTRYDSASRGDRLATAQWIAQQASEAQLVDARGEQEWCAGHIPGAVNCCWSHLSCGEESTLWPLPAAEIEEKLAMLALDRSRETVTYCRSGGRASWLYFVLRLMGWERVRNYDGSMNDWLLQEQPVERGC